MKCTKSAQKVFVFDSGLAVSEMRQAKIEVLHEMMVEEHKLRLEAFDQVDNDTLHNDFSRKSYSCGLRDAKVEEFKKSIEESDRKKM